MKSTHRHTLFTLFKSKIAVVGAKRRGPGCVALTLLLTGCATGVSGARDAAITGQMDMPPIRHVFVIVLENQPYETTFGANSPAPYLAHELPRRGALLENYYAIGHDSLDNYIAMVSGQAPNPATRHDCHVYSEFQRTRPGLDANGQAIGAGCIFPPDVKTLPDQLEAAGYTWKGYMEDMGANPKREAATCGHVPIGANDYTRQASIGDQYADKHNPFVYFHSIIDNKARCNAHVVNLRVLDQDLRSVATTPNFAYIVPNLCHDGHDGIGPDKFCVNGEPGGLVSADAFLRKWVPKITASPAFSRDGLLVITFDEGSDARACCGEQPLPGDPLPGTYGPGGGRIGAVALSPFIRAGTVSMRDYNHYSFLRSVENLFGLDYLGYAAVPTLRSFGADVFTARPR